MNKTFLITVDTEGDNLWGWHEGESITTENEKYISRFQNLCEKFGFIPTYLTNYEMAMDNQWVKYGRGKNVLGKCEIGLHIHAWNSPPIYHLGNKYGGHAYITEYPEEVISEKIQFLTRLLSDRFECDIFSARSGRWATDKRYFRALSDNGIFVDCSVTPKIDFSNVPGASVSNGSNYKYSLTVPHEIFPGIIEIPMTTRIVKWNAEGAIKHKLKSLLIGDLMWLRPINLSTQYLQAITDSVMREHTDYLEFMIHSSELMPGGSPYINTGEDVERLFEVIEWYFNYIAKRGFKGEKLTDYANYIKRNLK